MFLFFGVGEGGIDHSMVTQQLLWATAVFETIAPVSLSHTPTDDRTHTRMCMCIQKYIGGRIPGSFMSYHPNDQEARFSSKHVSRVCIGGVMCFTAVATPHLNRRMIVSVYANMCMNLSQYTRACLASILVYVAVDR